LSIHAVQVHKAMFFTSLARCKESDAWSSKLAGILEESPYLYC